MIKTKLYATIQDERCNKSHVLSKVIDLPIPPFIGFIIVFDTLGDLIVKDMYYDYDSKYLVCSLEPVYCDTKEEQNELKTIYLSCGRQ